MDTNANQVRKLHFITRPSPLPDDLADPRAFAWEILRRRADYAGTPAQIGLIEGTAAPIELIRPLAAASSWGLRFRRRP